MLLSRLQFLAGNVLWSVMMSLWQAPQAMAGSEGPYILLGNGDSIRRISLDGSEGSSVLNNSDYDIIGVDYDIRDGILLWTDVSRRTINRASLDGSNLTVLVDSSLRVPDGLAWDWVTKKVYWTDSGRRRIEVYDPVRDIRKLMRATGTQSLPRDIAVDPTTGWLFWTDWGSDPKIERMSMDGMAYTTIVSSDIVWPSGLAIDYQTLTLFWSDASLDRLESSDYNGWNRTILIERRFIFYPFGLAYHNGSLYWGDWVVGFVYRLTVIDPGDHGYVRAVLGNEPTGIKVVSETNQPLVETPCSVTNGGCSHLCLISSTAPAGYTCSCPRHFHLEKNGRDCRGRKATETSVTPTDPPSQGSCVNAGFTTCCNEESANCQGLPPVCSCSIECHSLGTCCPDIESVCPTQTPSEEFLVVANQDGIVRVNLSGESQTVLVRGEHHTTAVDFDISSQTIYWTDVVLGRIRRSFLNGSGVTTIISSGLESPGIAVDWINKMLYWTDARSKKVEVFDLHGGHRKLLITTGEDTIPRTIIVDPTTRWLYWSDWGEHALIERASMDGQNRQAIVSSDLVWPNGLTINVHSQSLYWADAMLDKIESSNVDGTNRHVLTTLGIFHPFSLTILDTELYWTDWELDVVLTGSSGLNLNARQLVRLNGSRPMGIQAVSSTRQPSVPSPCLENGTCSHLCLLSAASVDGYSCACPDGWMLRTNTNQCFNLQYIGTPDSDNEYKRVTSVQPSLTVMPSTPPNHSSVDFKLDVLPISLAVVIVVLSLLVTAMCSFLILRLRRAKDKKTFSFLERRCTAVPNVYTTNEETTAATSGPL